MHKELRLITAWVGLTALGVLSSASCSSSKDAGASLVGSGGAGPDGSTSTGGTTEAASTGGTLSAGGTMSTGGVAGATSKGGAGGTLSTGGTAGATSKGGAGGALSTGGTAGTTSTGGAGGTLSTGGTAGTTPTGGAGGTLSTGGTAGTTSKGGAGGTGGATGAGGGAGGSGSMADEIPNSGVYYYLDKEFSASPSGAVYYVSDCQTGADSNCVAGSDSNSGTSPASPWQSCSKLIAQFNRLQAGDKLLVAQGSMIDCSSIGNDAVFNTNCRAANPCVLDSYVPPWASGDEGPPVMHYFQLRFEDSGNADHDEGYVVRNLELRGDSPSGSGSGIYLYNDVDYVLFENLRINGYSVGVHCSGSNSPNPPNTDSTNDHITLRNSTITNNSGMGLLSTCNGVLIQSNTFDNNGFNTANLNHNIYLDASPTGQDVVIWGNTLRHSTVVNGKCDGVSLIAHGIWTNALVAYNHVEEDLGAATPGCWGISFDPAYSTAESFRGTVIRGNVVINVGNIGIGATSCPDCVIENNVIINEQSAYDAIAIAVPDRDRGAEDTPDDNVTIRNNSIYMGSQAKGTGISITHEGSSHLVVSNILEYMGSSSGWACVKTTELTTASFEAFDYNLCYFPNSKGKWETTAGALSAWTSATGLDSHSLSADPMLTSPAGPAYSCVLQSGSTAVSAGHPTLSSPYDIVHVKRDAKPDIGAYELTN